MITARLGDIIPGLTQKDGHLRSDLATELKVSLLNVARFCLKIKSKGARDMV